MPPLTYLKNTYSALQRCFSRCMWAEAVEIKGSGLIVMDRTAQGLDKDGVLNAIMDKASE